MGMCMVMDWSGAVSLKKMYVLFITVQSEDLLCLQIFMYFTSVGMLMIKCCVWAFFLIPFTQT